MAKVKPTADRGRRQDKRKVTIELPPIMCALCKGPIARGQHVAPVFSAKLVRWTEHPVLSKPPVIRGLISTGETLGRVDMSLGDQLRQRAAMGGEKERAELVAFEKLLAEWLAHALVAELRKETERTAATMCSAQSLPDDQDC